MKILVINGPNINMLGIREKEIYGSESYDDLCDLIKKHADEKNIDVTLFQSNHEGDIVDEIQKAYKKFDGIVINPAAYTHTSVAIADAVKGVGIPTVEVHISEVSKREDFRRISYIRDVACLTVTGMGFDGYLKALDHLAKNGRKEK